MLFKKINGYWILTLVLAGLILFEVHRGSDILFSSAAIQKEVYDLLEKDSSLISGIKSDLSSAGYEQKLGSLPFGVEIYQKNVLVWWNESARIIPKNKDARYIVFKNGDTDIVLRTELQELNGKHFVPVWRIGTYSEKPQNTFFFKGVEYTFTAPVEWLTFAEIWLFSLLCFFTLWWLIRDIRNFQGKGQSWMAASVVIILFRILFSLSWISGVLSPVFLYRSFGQNSLLWSPATFCLDTVLLWLVLYLMDKEKSKRRLRQMPVFVFFAGTAFVLGLLFIYWNSLMKIMVFDRHFHAEVSDILFFNMTSLWMIGVLIVNILAGFLILYSLFSFSKSMRFGGLNRYMMLLTGIAFTFPVFYYCELQINPVLFYLFLISVVLIIDVYSELKEQKLTYLLWWILMFSGYLAIGFFHYDQLKSGQAREEFLDSHFASSSPADVASAARIKEVLDTSNIFLQLGNLEYPAKWDKDEIKGLFGGLLKISPEQFDIELFDDNGFSLFANHFGNYHQIKKSLQLAHTEEGNNLFFHPIHQGYYLRYEILPEKHPEGPWLFVLSYGNKTSGEFDTQNLSYALLKRGYLVEKQFQANDMPSDQELMQVKGNGIQGRFQYTTRENNMGYTMLVFEDKPGLLKPISIFSFLFALTGILMIILTWINTGKPFLPEILPLKMGTKSSLKTKIQLSIILLIIFSFIVVGSVTAFYFYNLIQANQNSKEREETQILANSVIRESRDKENPEELIAYFYKNLLNLSYVHGKSLQLYDAQGKLLATSKSEPSEYIIPYYKATGNKISAGRNVKNTEENHFDYITLIDNNDQKAGYLGIQHHYTNISMKSIIDFLGTILNVYIFLFLIAGVIAITIANSITQPIAILAEKLKQFKLGRTNEYLEWQSNDEIGTLITEYNNLNEALTRSAEMLAKTERDMAWREMAKQVAHEIKNPLTPMKLSIQYLEKAAKEDPERAKDMIPRVSNTLIEQIDNLSQIAVEFSNFASMPQANNEKVALNELVVTIHDLFRKRDDMDVTLSTPIDDLVVFADKNHLVRILNNLVKNAIQAIPDDRRGKIDISLYQENNHAVVRVTDNGSGIPESMKSKVFAPNFTTKSSGTGLGLAISANMIESFNGKIYFESEENKGTRFYIRIPLMRKEEGRGDLRVSLDE